MGNQDVGFVEQEFTTRINKGREAVAEIEAVARRIDGTSTNVETAIKGGWANAQKAALMEVNAAATKLRGVMDRRNTFLDTYRNTQWGTDTESEGTTYNQSEQVANTVRQLNG